MQIDFSRSFKKDLRKAPLEIQEAATERIDLFRRNPYHPFLRSHPLRGKWLGYCSINITGDWRAVYEVQNKTVLFVALGTHSQLY